MKFPTWDHFLAALTDMGGQPKATTKPKVERLLLEVRTDALHEAGALLFNAIVDDESLFGGRRAAMAVWMTDAFYQRNGRQLVIRARRVLTELAEKEAITAADLRELTEELPGPGSSP